MQIYNRKIYYGATNFVTRKIKRINYLKRIYNNLWNHMEGMGFANNDHLNEEGKGKK